MRSVSVPVVKIFYNGRNISQEMSQYLISVRYTDKVIGESDEIEIQLEDTDGRWMDGWYPVKGDRIKLQYGFDDTILDCGEFEVDEISLSGPPDTVSIRAVAAWVTTPMRTRDSKAHENKTLREIVQYVASKNGLTLDDGFRVNKVNTVVTLKNESSSVLSIAGVLERLNSSNLLISEKNTLINSIVQLKLNADKSTSKGFPNIGHSIYFTISVFEKVYKQQSSISSGLLAEYLDAVKKLKEIAAKMASADLVNTTTTTTARKLYTIRIARSTQDREPDLAYLKRLADQFGFAFSIRGTKLIFTSIYELEDGLPVKEIDKTEMSQYSITDKTSETFSSAVVKYQNSKTKSLVTYEVKTASDSSDVAFSKVVKKDVLYVKDRAENKEQAELMAKSALHKKNSLQQVLSFTIYGDPLLVAGNNIIVSGFGQVSGRYHIMSSTHTIDKSNGYSTECECKRVGYVQKVKQKPKKPRKKKAPVYQIIK